MDARAALSYQITKKRPPRPDHYDFQRSRAPWIRKFYYEDLYGFIRRQVPTGSRVLDLGCGDGRLLASLRPSYGVGIDSSPIAVREARNARPHLHFVCADVTRLPLRHDARFDYVIVSNVIGYLDDVWLFLRNLRTVVTPDTRVLFTYYNFVWEPLLKLAERLNLKASEPPQNWISAPDLVNLLDLAHFDPVSSGYRATIPAGPSRLVRPVNRLISLLPLLRNLGLTSYVVARPSLQATYPRLLEPSCTVVIPTRNERGNIRPALERLKPLGTQTEVIFVDGDSTDGTAEEIERLIPHCPHLDVKLIDQGDGVGKGDAVRKGFAAANGEVLMILDADLTVPPEDLPKFWHALVEEKGEFINGTRLVYPMEDQAMRIANIFGNKLFRSVFSWILDQRITDTLCGTKALWASDYAKIAAQRHYFGDFDPFGDFDLLFGASKAALKIREVPIRYRARTYGTTNISRWRHGVLLLRMAAKGARKLRFN